MLLILLAECATLDGPTEMRQLSAENWASLPTVYYLAGYCKLLTRYLDKFTEPLFQFQLSYSSYRVR